MHALAIQNIWMGKHAYITQGKKVLTHVLIFRIGHKRFAVFAVIWSDNYIFELGMLSIPLDGILTVHGRRAVACVFDAVFWQSSAAAVYGSQLVMIRIDAHFTGLKRCC